MSLETLLGAEQNVFEQTADHADRLILTSPVLSPDKFDRLMHVDSPRYPLARIELAYDPALTSLQDAVTAVAEAAEAAVRSGKVILLLSDRAVEPGMLVVHSLLATGAVHHHLIKQGLRCDANIVVETGSGRDSHQMACLFGFGATAVYPYMAFAVISDMLESGEILGDEQTAHTNYCKGINKGLLKIMSKMGISTIASYRGAQLFEAIGLADEIVDTCFKGVASRIAGAGF